MKPVSPISMIFDRKNEQQESEIKVEESVPGITDIDLSSNHNRQKIGNNETITKVSKRRPRAPKIEESA